MNWLNRSLVESPYFYCLCLSQKEFDKVCKKSGFPSSSYVTKGKDATCHGYQSSEGELAAVICLRVSGRKRAEVHGILVHEAMHLWQYTKESLGEAAPSAEFEAYAVQALTQNLFEEFEKRRKKCK